MPTYFLKKKILCDHCLHDYYLYIRKMLTNREMVNFQKEEFFSIFLYTFTVNFVTTGARKMPIEFLFCFFVANNAYKSFRRAKIAACLVLYSRKLFLITLPLLF